MRIVLSTLLIILLFGCSSNENQIADSINENNNLESKIGELVERVHHYSRLEVAEYTMLKIVSFDDNSKLNIYGHSISLPGERKLMIPIEVKMKVIVDLNFLIEKDIVADSSTIHITLPSPKLEIYSTRIDNEKEKESVSWYRSNFTEQERENFIKQGVEDVKKNISSLEINNIAKSNTEKVLQPILHKIGLSQHVEVTFKEIEINTPSFKD